MKLNKTNLKYSSSVIINNYICIKFCDNGQLQLRGMDVRGFVNFYADNCA